jgi:branched-subunit amino acid transport protein
MPWSISDTEAGANMIDPTYFWKTVSLLALGTIMIRFSIIAVSGKVTISDRLKEVFSFIPAAVLPAIIAPMVFFHEGSVDWFFGKERLLVLILATVVSYKTKSMLATVSFGLVVLYLITQF